MNSFYPAHFTSRRVKQLTPWFPSRQVWLAIAMMSISKPELSAASSFDLGNYLAPEISVQSAVTDGSQIKGHQGEVSSSSHQITLHNELLYFQYEQWDVDWEKVEQLPFGDQRKDPNNHMHRIQLGANYFEQRDPKSWLLISLGVSSAFEDSMKDSYSVTGLGIFNHRWSPDWSFSVGAFSYYHPVQSRLDPVIGVGYREDNPYGLSATLGFPQTTVGYGFNPKWRLESSLTYRQFLSKLANNNPIEQDGYAEFETYQWEINAIYALTKQWRALLGVTHDSDYQFTIYDNKGHKQNRYDVESAWGGQVGIRYQF